MSEGLEVALVLKSEIEQELRLDSELFQRKFINLAKLVAENQITKLGDESLSIKKGIFDIKADSYSEHGVPFVRISNLKNMLIDTKDIIYIPEHESRNNPDSFLKKNDIILSKTAYPAASLVNLDFCNASQDTIAVKLKHDSKLMSHFVVVYLNTVFGLEAMKRRFTGNIQMHLNLEDCKNLSIPVLSYSFQQKVKDVFEQGIISTVNSKSAYASAEALLLQSLGLSDFDFDAGDGVNSNIKPFAASFLESGRLDAEYYQRKYEHIIGQIAKRGIRVVEFGEVIKFLHNGAEIRAYVEENGTRYLRVTDLSKEDINDNSPRLISKQAPPARLKLNKNCLLIARSGSLGLVNIVTDDLLNAVISSHIFKVELDTNLVSPIFLETYFRSKIGQEFMLRQNNGGVVPEINHEGLRRIPIPVLSKGEMDSVTHRLLENRINAKKLKDTSKKLLTLAKQAVETAIEQGEAAGEALLYAALSEETT